MADAAYAASAASDSPAACSQGPAPPARFLQPTEPEGPPPLKKLKSSDEEWPCQWEGWEFQDSKFDWSWNHAVCFDYKDSDRTSRDNAWNPEELLICVSLYV